MKTEDLSIIDQLALLRITASADIPPHEFLYSWNGTPCFARGELVAVTGKAKSGKTYLNSLLMAAAGGTGCLGLQRLREQPLRVVWIDTEQSEDTTCEILRDRIGPLMDRPPDDDHYHVFNLRQVRWQDRITLVLSAIAICKPELVIFDGIRDVVGDINNYEEAQNTIAQLLRVASEFRTCIVCVLHQNKAVEDKTLRGALGSELQNKSFETYECSKNPDTRIFSVRQSATRKYDMPNRIDFCLSPDGLPMACTPPEPSSSSPAPAVRAEKTAFNPDFVSDNKIDKNKLFGYILSDKKQMSLAQLRQVVMKVANIQSFNFAFRVIEEARLCGILDRVDTDTGSYYQLSA